MSEKPTLENSVEVHHKTTIKHVFEPPVVQIEVKKKDEKKPEGAPAGDKAAPKADHK